MKEDTVKGFNDACKNESYPSGGIYCRGSSHTLHDLADRVSC